MHIVVLAALVAALFTLVFGLLTTTAWLVVVSIACSLVALLVAVRSRPRDDEAESVAAPHAEQPELGDRSDVNSADDATDDGEDTADEPDDEDNLEPDDEADAGSAAGPSPNTDEHDDGALADTDGEEPATGQDVADDDPDVRGDKPGAVTSAVDDEPADNMVQVIDGRPRYHRAECRFLIGRDAEPITLEQAVDDGFTPCAVCRPPRPSAA